MKAVWLPDENLWQITEGERWWTAVCRPDNPHGWVIANEKLRYVVPSSQLGRRIVKAVETAMERGTTS